jgi:hypothetical protein
MRTWSSSQSWECMIISSQTCYIFVNVRSKQLVASNNALILFVCAVSNNHVFHGLIAYYWYWANTGKQGSEFDPLTSQLKPHAKSHDLTFKREWHSIIVAHAIPKILCKYSSRRPWHIGGMLLCEQEWPLIIHSMQTVHWGTEWQVVFADSGFFGSLWLRSTNTIIQLQIDGECSIENLHVEGKLFSQLSLLRSSPLLNSTQVEIAAVDKVFTSQSSPML